MARIRFNHWRGLKEGHRLAFPPLVGTFAPGDVIDLSPRRCEAHGRQCHQLNGTPCTKGADCDCWAELLIADWNQGHGKSAVKPLELLPDAAADSPAAHESLPIPSQEPLMTVIDDSPPADDAPLMPDTTETPAEGEE